METVIEAVVEAFELSVGPKRKEVAWLTEEGDTAVAEIHYTWRVYWPQETLRSAWQMEPVQPSLLL